MVYWPDQGNPLWENGQTSIPYHPVRSRSNKESKRLLARGQWARNKINLLVSYENKIQPQYNECITTSVNGHKMLRNVQMWPRFPHLFQFYARDAGWEETVLVWVSVCVCFCLLAFRRPFQKTIVVTTDLIIIITMQSSKERRERARVLLYYKLLLSAATSTRPHTPNHHKKRKKIKKKKEK